MYQFSKVGFWGRLADDRVAAAARQVIAHLDTRKVQVFAPPSAAALASGAQALNIIDEAELVSRADIIVAVGGDGTMLHAARRVADRGVPLVGINLGRLGFLTDVLPEQMLEALDDILSGHCLREDRRMLEARIVSAQTTRPSMLALNDVTLQKRETGRILDFTTLVDGSYINTQGGDGLIVATPTGSTAYALSCGGPIIQPDIDALVIVPICPHTLSDRPIVLNGSSTIEINLQADEDLPAPVACDGESYGVLSAGETLRIQAARATVTLLHPKDYNYYELLRSKLNWGSTQRVRRSRVDTSSPTCSS